MRAARVVRRLGLLTRGRRELFATRVAALPVRDFGAPRQPSHTVSGCEFNLFKPLRCQSSIGQLRVSGRAPFAFWPSRSAMPATQKPQFQRPTADAPLPIGCRSGRGERLQRNWILGFPDRGGDRRTKIELPRNLVEKLLVFWRRENGRRFHCETFSTAALSAVAPPETGNRQFGC